MCASLLALVDAANFVWSSVPQEKHMDISRVHAVVYRVHTRNSIFYTTSVKWG